MKNNWQEIIFSELLTLQRGYDLPRREMEEGDIPVAGSNGIIGYHSKYTCDGPGVTIGRSGNIGNAYFYEKKFWAHNTTLFVKDFKGNDEKYVYFLLKNMDFYRFNSGSAVPTLNRNHLSTLIVNVPPLPEQKVIAGVLSALDDKIDLLHRQNRTLETLAQTLFRQWFIDEAGDDWAETSLDQIADYMNGIACQKYPPKDEIHRLPVLKIKELGNGVSDTSDWASTNVSEEYIVHNGDVIFSWSGSLMIKIWDGEDCILNQHLFKVSSNNYPKWFFYFWTKYHLAKFISIAEGKSTTMGHIKRSDLSNSEVYLPPSDLLNEKDRMINPLIEKNILNNRQIITLQRMRDTLLPKLMSGEVRVSYGQDH